MTASAIDIDQVVREVLAQLGSAAREPDPAPVPTAVAPFSAAEKPAPRPTNGDGQLVVTDRVVTLAALAERLGGVRRLVVPPRAVVTPAVRDELRRKNIALVFAQAEAAKTNGSGGERIVMVVAGSYDPAALVASLGAERMAVEVERTDCLMAASDRLAAELKNQETLGVLATGYPAAGACLANRLPGLRAVPGYDAGTLAAETASIGANVLVVNPRSHGPVQLKQLVLQFARASHECPEVFRERLA